MYRAYLIKLALSTGSPIQAKLNRPFTQDVVPDANDTRNMVDGLLNGDKLMPGLPPAVKAGPLMAGVERKKAIGARNALFR